jgi:voltage-gated potassium channel
MLANRKLKVFTRLFIPIFMIIGILMLGTGGYIIIEGFNFLEALYMTVITMATVGFGEVHPLSSAGRIFTIILILLNIGLFTYFITILSQYLMDGEFIRNYKSIKMENSIQKLNQHVIICGFGRNGKESGKILSDNKTPFVVLEDKEELDTTLDFEVPYYIKGDATKDELLIDAGIKNARALITTLPVDADNLFVVLTAKQLNPSLQIITRASQDSSVKKFLIAGASHVVMPDKIGGAHMATLILSPHALRLLSIINTKNNKHFRIAEIVSEKNILLKDLDMWNRTNCTILGVKNSQNHYILNPSPAYNLVKNEQIIVMGSEEQIDEAKKLVG